MSLSYFDEGLMAVTLVAVVLMGLLVLRPGLTRERGGKILAFIAFFIFPILITWAGTSAQLEHSKTTSFCLSCHVMTPWGKSLHLADEGHLPAAHYQNHRVPPDEACYTCHTTYTMFGGIEAKLRGVRHLYVNYLGTLPEKIQLYEPYNNRECLHCHEGARSFESQEDHQAIRAELVSNAMSCLDCHAEVHDIEDIDTLPLWKEPQT
jgi:nitrate/TMAO reductase-like tetraheme cytochrome c subunit